MDRYNYLKEYGGGDTAKGLVMFVEESNRLIKKLDDYDYKNRELLIYVIMSFSKAKKDEDKYDGATKFIQRLVFEDRVQKMSITMFKKLKAIEEKMESFNG